jgi:hypothetical protein
LDVGVLGAVVSCAPKREKSIDTSNNLEGFNFPSTVPFNSPFAFSSYSKAIVMNEGCTELEVRGRIDELFISFRDVRRVNIRNLMSIKMQARK